MVNFSVYLNRRVFVMTLAYPAPVPLLIVFFFFFFFFFCFFFFVFLFFFFFVLSLREFVPFSIVLTLHALNSFGTKFQTIFVVCSVFWGLFLNKTINWK